MTVAVSLERVSRVFGSLEILRAVDLEVNLGEAAAVVGPSGIGKTTLLRIVATIDRPTKGKLFLLGRDVTSASRKELAELRWSDVAFSFQEPVLLPDLTALENVLIPCMPRSDRDGLENYKEKASNLLERLGLLERLEFRPSQLSAGQKKRVDLARALLNDPPILVVDEPTSNLDEESAKIITDTLRERLEENSAIVFSTHRDQQLLAVADMHLKL
ncbi:MAG: ABC transporter ATP-binding protein [Candidatus Geothermarchaeales archaeon]